jgi:hypothetical protein
VVADAVLPGMNAGISAGPRDGERPRLDDGNVSPTWLENTELYCSNRIRHCRNVTPAYNPKSNQ